MHRKKRRAGGWWAFWSGGVPRARVVGAWVGLMVVVASAAETLGRQAFSLPKRPLQPIVSPLPTGGRLSGEEGFPYQVDFSDEAFEVALERSVKEAKVLIVVRDLAPGSPGHRNWWQHPTVAAWTRWHAIVLDPGEEHLRPLHEGKGLGCDIYVGGVLLKDILPDPTKDGPGPAGLAALAAAQMGATPPPTLMPVTLLGYFDDRLQAAKARDPMFAEAHDRLNPPPALPDAGGLLSQSGVGGMRVSDPEAARETPGALPDAMGMMLRGQAALERGDWHAASGLLTWVWERGPANDPAIEPVRRVILPFEAARLLGADVPEEIRERFLSLRDRAAMALPWHEWPLTLDWTLLSTGLGEMGPMVEWFDFKLNDLDELAGRSVAEQLSLRMMIDASDAVKAGDAGELMRLAHRLADGALPKKVDRREAAKLNALRREVAYTLSCAAYARELKRATSAALVEDARALAVANGGAHAARGLVACALVVDRVRPEHLAMLEENARAAGVPLEIDPLVAHVRERLGEKR